MTIKDLIEQLKAKADLDTIVKVKGTPPSELEFLYEAYNVEIHDNEDGKSVKEFVVIW